MRERRSAQERRHAREFARFAAGAAARLLPATTQLGLPAEQVHTLCRHALGERRSRSLVTHHRRARRLGRLLVLLAPGGPGPGRRGPAMDTAPAHTTPRVEGW
ncbi:hypothetical protein [Streptomyces sp. NPDC048637]|uniref:hypothetical protein n=1 Tax=Streptomyces sp. NPDC048637 TaxID=3155636 RepID=UPI00343B2762